MPECQNCGTFVTEAYVRVFSPNDVEHPRACPDCPDKVRRNGQIRDARSSREGGSDPTEYDPEKDPTVDTTTSEGAADSGGEVDA